MQDLTPGLPFRQTLGDGVKNIAVCGFGVQAQRHAVVHDGGSRETALALAVALVRIKQIANER